MSHGQARTIPSPAFPSMPLLPPLTNFDQASRSIVSYLDDHLPFALWSITRFDGANQIFLTVSPNPLHIEVGETRVWQNTMCSEVVCGNAPPVSTNRELVPALSRDDRWEGIGAYVSIPILHSDGSLFGTLCGADPTTGDSGLEDNEALLTLLCRLLGTILD
ncbi:GAF domain-containing protein, partial [Streptomyces sp. NPDC050698]